MTSWQEDLLSVAFEARHEQAVYTMIEVAARSLGFEHWAYGLRMPLPLSNPKTLLLNNYPAPWQERYLHAGYLASDPTVLHGSRSQAPLIWHDSVFESTPDLWHEARSFGLRIGWAQSCLDVRGVGGMLTLSRSYDPLSDAELAAHESKMRWLGQVAHLSLAQISTVRLNERMTAPLTAREVEVLKWTGDGKTCGEISTLLSLSDNSSVRLKVEQDQLISEIGPFWPRAIGLQGA
jgi:Autoinducer binding domain